MMERKIKIKIKNEDSKDNLQKKNTNCPLLKKIKQRRRSNYAIHHLKTNDNKLLEFSNSPIISKNSPIIDNKQNYYQKILQYNDYELNTLQYNIAKKNR